MSTDDSTPYILGLDLGVASIGWAMIACDPDDNFRPVSIMRAGSHIFESGTEGDINKIEAGRDVARNVQRRTARLSRRQLWRRARRRRVVLNTLIRLKLLPAPEALGLAAVANLKRPLDIDAYMKTVDDRLRQRWRKLRAADAGTPQAHADEQRLCYLLREAAARSAVDRTEFGRALYHLAQRRGFLSNRRADAKVKDDEQGAVKEAISDLAMRIASFGASGGIPTLGAYLASLDPDEQRLRGRWTARAMYVDEFQRMWSTQAPHLGLDDAAQKEIFRAIFFQRPLKDQSNLIGRCSILPEEKRCPVAHRQFQRFRMLQAVNHLTVAEPAQPARGLTKIERDALISSLASHGDLTFAAVRKLLKMKRGTTFNLERGDEKRIVGHRTDAKLRAIFGDQFDTFSEDDKDRMVEDLRSFRVPSALERRAVRRWGLDSERATRFAATNLEEDYASLSLAALRRLLPRMEEGTPYSTARREEFPDSFLSGEPVALLPPVLDAIEDLRNPAVTRTLTEARKLINEMIRRFGKPALVRIELAREIKTPRKVRERITKNMREREKTRAVIVAQIQKEAGIGSPRRDAIERVLLAEECGWICPYTGRQISWATLLGPEPQFDVEHIWPRSRSLDDSFANKTLCYHEENRARKRGFTPREAYGGNAERFGEIIARMRLWNADQFTIAEKIARFEAEQIPDGFSHRHLSDTRFIARAAADYIGLLYGGRVQAGAGDEPGKRRVETVTGGLTGWLRSGWGIDGLLGDNAEKNREDHRHHAVDAIVIALSDARAVQALAAAASDADRLGKRRAFEAIELPWRTFRDDAAGAVQRVVVSHRQSRKVSGPLHDQSLYSKPITRGKESVHRIRKELHKLTWAEVRDGKIVDKRALAAIRSTIEGKFGAKQPTPQDLQKLFSDPAHAPIIGGAHGKSVRLRKVRVDADAGRCIGPEAHARWVSPSNNHHTVIVEYKDSKGRTRWKDCPVQLLDAYQRQAMRQPIVSRAVGNNERFVFSLAPGEFVEIDSPDGSGRRALFRVSSLSEGDNELKYHADARTADQLKKTKSRVRARGDRLRELNARKVHVTYLGEVRDAGG